MDENDTVLDLKHQIRGKEGIPTKHTRLNFAGEQLEKGRALSFYNIWNELELDLVLY